MIVCVNLLLRPLISFRIWGIDKWIVRRIAQWYIDWFLPRIRTAAIYYYLYGNFTFRAIIDARFAYTNQISLVLLVDDYQVSKVTEQLVLSQFFSNYTVWNIVKLTERNFRYPINNFFLSHSYQVLQQGHIWYILQAFIKIIWIAPCVVSFIGCDFFFFLFVMSELNVFPGSTFFLYFNWLSRISFTHALLLFGVISFVKHLK